MQCESERQVTYNCQNGRNMRYFGFPLRQLRNKCICNAHKFPYHLHAIVRNTAVRPAFCTLLYFFHILVASYSHCIRCTRPCAFDVLSI